MTQGVRRIVAVTGEEAAAAVQKGKSLGEAIAAAKALSGKELEQTVSALKTVSDQSFSPPPPPLISPVAVHWIVCTHLQRAYVEPRGLSSWP